MDQQELRTKELLLESHDGKPRRADSTCDEMRRALRGTWVDVQVFVRAAVS